MNDTIATATATATVTAETPAEVLGAVYAALGAGDLAAAAARLHPDVVLHVPGTHAAAGDHVGSTAVLAFIERALGGTERVERIEVLDLLGGAEHAAVLCNAEGYRDGVHAMHNRTLHLVRVLDGSVRDIWFHNWDQSVVDDFWA